ncbi:MAG: hypothetical protein AAGK14_13125 [Verrucomicrobiota bacterium]
MALLFEAGLLLAGLLLLLRLTPLHAFFRGLPGPHAAVAFVFLFLLFGGQFLLEPKLSYPFLDWSMYSGRDRGPAEWCELTGTDAEGNEVALRPLELMPVFKSMRPQRRLLRLAKRSETRRPRKLLQAWGRCHEDQTGVDLVELRAEVVTQAGPGEPKTRRVIFRVDEIPPQP